MSSPDYIQRQINEAFEAHTPLDIRVVWDGFWDEDTTFKVLFEGVDTGLHLLDSSDDYYIEILTQTSPNTLETVTDASSYEEVAREVTEIVKNEFADIIEERNA